MSDNSTNLCACLIGEMQREEIIRLRDAVLFYGDHRHDCEIGDLDILKCSCGFHLFVPEQALE